MPKTLSPIDEESVQTTTRSPVRPGALAMLGPAFVAAVAYVDPGNFATNISGGAEFGYLLLWVIVAANLHRHAHPEPLGEDGHRDGAQPARAVPRATSRARSRWGLWVQAELVAMATDLAEFVGAAIALNLLFGVPLFPAGIITAIVSFAVLGLQRRGHRRFEVVIVGMLGVVLLGFLYDTLRIGFDAGDAAKGLVPGFDGTDSVLLATGILGATVMPHVIYLHSALTQRRIVTTTTEEKRRRSCASSASTSTIAMGLAGLANMAMLIVAASLFHDARR